MVESDDDKIKIRNLLAIIETSCTPHEVVTWMLQNKLKVELDKERMVYDAHVGVLGQG